MQKYIVQNIKTPIEASIDDVFAVARNRLLKLFSKQDLGNFHVYKKSVDARKKNDISFVWSVMAEADTCPKDEKLALKLNIVHAGEETISPVFGTEMLTNRPVIVGFGPCGMFAALLLARNGYRPIVIERGADVEQRTKDVARFSENEILSPNSNIQFGAGGAGTFSDGKLITRINDPLGSFVLEEMVKAGAPEDILYSAKPHIGTDYLKAVVSHMEKEIVSLGGEVRYLTTFDGFNNSSRSIKSLHTDIGDIACGAVVLAIGHSARDTFSKLRGQDVLLTPKPFSVGVRIEHLQKEIDRALYGDMAGHPLLPVGEYNLSCHNKERGVYTFCMCPGGEVVAAASEENSIVTNGMSHYKRDGKNANCAVAVSVFTSDYGNTVEKAIAFQQSIEKNAYKHCASYRAPCETVGHFLQKSTANAVTDVIPTYMGGKVSMTDLTSVFPSFIIESLQYGLSDFGKKIKGFDADSAVLTGPETRTSSPIRIPRTEAFLANGFDNLYVGGEGAGYAGGITSAAIDGIHLALALMARYKPIAD